MLHEKCYCCGVEVSHDENTADSLGNGTRCHGGLSHAWGPLWKCTHCGDITRTQARATPPSGNCAHLVVEQRTSCSRCGSLSRAEYCAVADHHTLDEKAEIPTCAVCGIRYSCLDTNKCYLLHNLVTVAASCSRAGCNFDNGINGDCLLHNYVQRY
jgi:hypothetical protein